MVSGEKGNGKGFNAVGAAVARWARGHGEGFDAKFAKGAKFREGR
jgi:hypothetical protein